MLGGLILAAGSGSRFGPESKLVEDLGGRPLLEHAIGAMCAVFAVDPIVVVLGAQADVVRARVRFGRAGSLVCEGWSRGISETLKCGVRALASADRVLVSSGRFADRDLERRRAFRVGTTGSASCLRWPAGTSGRAGARAGRCPALARRRQGCSRIARRTHDRVLGSVLGDGCRYARRPRARQSRVGHAIGERSRRGARSRAGGSSPQRSRVAGRRGPSVRRSPRP